MKRKDELNDFIDILLSDEYNANMQLPDPSLVQFYDELENRIVWVTGEIGDSTLDIVSKIIKWNREDKDLPIKERKPIRLLINSPGGSLDTEETLVSIIKLSKTPVYGVALGMVASAASLIYLSCHKRFALPNAYFILHRGSCQNMGGNYNEIQAAMEDYRAQIEKWKSSILKIPVIQKKSLRKRLKLIGIFISMKQKNIIL